MTLAAVAAIRPLPIEGEASCRIGQCGGVGRWTRGSSSKKRRPGRVHLCSSMVGDAWRDSRDAGRVIWRLVKFHRRHSCRVPVVVDEIGGQYEDSYEDVYKHLLDYFTYKAVRTVLVQLYEMNPSQYMWLYNFVATNKPKDSKYFIRLLVKERQELAERVMVTRLHLFGKWVKKYNHEDMYNLISDQNLEVLRERLMQTVKLPSDDEDQ